MAGLDISVVMAANNPGAAIAECLESLARQTFFSRAEIIVAECSTDGTDARIRTEFPWVTLLHFDRPVGLPELMKEAMRQARGKVMAVTDPHCVFPPDLLEKLFRAHQSDYAVIGGAVENGRSEQLLDWACYFADYAAFMLPSARRATFVLAGNHVTYKSWVIKEALDSMEGGFRKVFFHWELERRGVRFLFDPELVVYYARRNTFAGFMRGYYQHAWLFAAVRTKRMSVAARFMRIITVPVLPAFLLYQRIRPALGKKRNRGKLLLSIPLLALFVTAWATGELKGYLLGPTSLSGEVYR